MTTAALSPIRNGFNSLNDLVRGRNRPAARALPTYRALLAHILIVFSLITIWVFSYLVFFSGIQETRSQQQLYASFREQLANGDAAVNQPIKPGTPVAIIQGAGLGELVVVEGTRSEQLESGPGHLSTSPLPGQQGTSKIFGKATTFGGPFGNLAKTPVGEDIAVTTAQGQFKYSVIAVLRPGDPLPPTPALGQGRLMLESTQTTGLFGWSPNHAIYVYAQLVGQVQPTPDGRPTKLADGENAMDSQIDTTTLLEIVLWMQLLAVTSVIAAWLRGRWNPSAIWLVISPVIALGAWGLSSTIVRLLPNLM